MSWCRFAERTTQTKTRSDVRGCDEMVGEVPRCLTVKTAFIVIDEVSNVSKVYDLEWPEQYRYLRFFCGRFFCENKLLPDVSAAISTAAKSIKCNKLPAHSVSIEIYSAIARFTCDNMDFLLSKSVLSRLKSSVFSSRVKSHFISKSSTLVDLTSFQVEVGSDCTGTGDSQVYFWYNTS